MTLPAIRALQTSVPDRRITLLTSRSGAAAASLAPDLFHQVLVFDAPWLKAADMSGSRLLIYRQARKLKKLGFDAAIIFTVYSQNSLPAALLCYLADIPVRIAHCRENPYRLLSHWVKDPEPEHCVRHEVQRQLDLVNRIGAHTDDKRIRVHIDAHVRATLDQRLRDLFLADKPLVLLHTGASAPSRRYPAERFALVARKLVTECHCEVAFTGVSEESELIDRIRTWCKVPTHSFAGMLGLPELAALLSRAALLISNNTAPVHLAAAVGTPVIDLYALTNPQHTPWQVPHRLLFFDVPCRYCYKSVCPAGHHDCLRRVDHEAVVNAAKELLGLHTPSKPIRYQPRTAQRRGLH